MDIRCRDGQYWDVLVKTCMSCNKVCRHMIFSKCSNYCASARCKKMPGHYYDELVNRCVRCVDICARHPMACSQHCRNQSQSVTTERVLGKVTAKYSLSVPASLEDSTMLLYSLLALCVALLLSSLCLALVVFLRGSRHRASKPRPKEVNHTLENMSRSDLKPGWQDVQLGLNSQDSVRNSSRAIKHTASDDPRPTETCVCIHCFPDPTSLGHSNGTLHKAAVPFYQQATLHRAQSQNGGPRWTERRIHPTELEEEGAAMGCGHVHECMKGNQKGLHTRQ